MGKFPYSGFVQPFQLQLNLLCGYLPVLASSGVAQGPGSVQHEEEQGGRVDPWQHLHQEAIDPADVTAQAPGLGQQVRRA